MSITRECLLKQYKDVLSSLSEQETFMRTCMDWLSIADVHNCFKVLPFANIKNGYLGKVKDKNLVKFDELEDALKNLEKYVQNLWKKPWCKSFYMIKIFNGFFKYKIEQWIPLDTVCRILELMGYHKTSEGIFEIEKLNKDRVLVVGLELLFAHTQLYLCRTRLLGNYTVDSILEAWIQTNGSSTEMLENGSFNEIIAKVSFEPSSDSSQVTTKSNAVTTTTQHQCYDKNGQSTHKTIALEQDCKKFSKDDMPMLSTSSISDDQMYGDHDETNATTEVDHYCYMYLPSHRKQAFCYSGQFEETRNSGKYNMGAYTSMPSVSLKSKQDFQSLKYHQSKNNLQNLSAEQLYGSSIEDNLRSKKKYKEDSVSIDSEKTKENLVTPMKSSGLFSLQNLKEESLDEGKERCQKILQARLEAGEKHLQQELTKDFDEIIIATDVTNLEQQCCICGNAAVVSCGECRQAVCKECSSILQRKPCKKNTHVYFAIKNNESLYENLSSLQVHSDGIEKKEVLFSCADSNKWECTNCTFLNSPEISVCVTCSRTKDAKVQKIKAGEWICFECTAANSENEDKCKVCETERKMSIATCV